MSLNKAIASGKEHRKEYTHAKAVDRTCRNHGGRSGGTKKQCPWCLDNRTYSSKKREQEANQRIKEFFGVDFSQMIGKKYKEKKNDKEIL